MGSPNSISVEERPVVDVSACILSLKYQNYGLVQPNTIHFRYGCMRINFITRGHLQHSHPEFGGRPRGNADSLVLP